ncbi:MAG TPA: hypothetical protein VLA29_09325 [Acidimicrobiia bacterium]|nr:hypothetical protein [Acidimicrobiia bacterium]
MRIPRIKRSRSDDPQTTSGPIVVSGFIEVPSQPEPLAVTLTVDTFSVALRTKDMELGSWLLAEVTITPITSKRFSFEAEGDRLVFRPDDPATLSSHTIVTRGSSAASAEKKPRSPERPKGLPSAEARSIRWERPRFLKKARTPGQDQARSPNPQTARSPRVEKEAPQTSRWLRTVDSARRRGFFNLDRVPVNEGLRGQEHQHTFDHGTAASSGPASHICTICGKVRIRAGRH